MKQVIREAIIVFSSLLIGYAFGINRFNKMWFNAGAYYQSQCVNLFHHFGSAALRNEAFEFLSEHGDLPDVNELYEIKARLDTTTTFLERPWGADTVWMAQ